MAGTLTHRAANPVDQTRCLDLIEAVYGKRPSEEVLPKDRIVIEEDGRIVAFFALYRFDDVVIGGADWITIESERRTEDMSRILGEMLERYGALKKAYGLRIVVIQTPYDEIRSHLDAPDIQEGEQQIRRLVASNALER